jgi:hypothetical protein
VASAQRRQDAAGSEALPKHGRESAGEPAEAVRRLHRVVRCLSTEADRVEMTLRQPQSMQNYTAVGFKKIRAPEVLFGLIQEFWEKNRDKAKPEQWGVANTYTNNWESASTMVSVEDVGLRGGGNKLKQQIWDAAREVRSLLFVDLLPLVCLCLFVCLHFWFLLRGGCPLLRAVFCSYSCERAHTQHTLSHPHHSFVAAAISLWLLLVPFFLRCRRRRGRRLSANGPDKS